LISDLGPVPLEEVKTDQAFNYKRVVGSDNIFTEDAPVIEGHTYIVLLSKSDIRALFVLHVDQLQKGGAMTISYSVKSYSIQNTIEESTGFDWDR
jgi:hypothetical protein